MGAYVEKINDFDDFFIEVPNNPDIPSHPAAPTNTTNPGVYFVGVERKIEWVNAKNF